MAKGKCKAKRGMEGKTTHTARFVTRSEVKEGAKQIRRDEDKKEIKEALKEKYKEN